MFQPPRIPCGSVINPELGIGSSPKASILTPSHHTPFRVEAVMATLVEEGSAGVPGLDRFPFPAVQSLPDLSLASLSR